MLTNTQVRILKWISPANPSCCNGSAYEGKSKLTALLGPEFFRKIVGKVVVDFGCGDGREAIEMAKRGAKQVIGIDIRKDLLHRARKRALDAGVSHRCLFTSATEHHADIVISVDTFEHVSDPAGALRIMHRIVHVGGEVLISFGPTWYHPLGGHLFSVFPWAHLIFSEKALLRWRSSFKMDGAKRFSEVAGGLNQMTIQRFERLINDSPFRLASLEFVPIGKVRHFHNRITREFTTAIVRCHLMKPEPAFAVAA